MADENAPAPREDGDLIPPGSEIIEVHVGELKQLFNSIDPSPFREKDIDPAAEEFIVDWAREVNRTAPLALLIHLDRSPESATAAAHVGEAVREYFRARAKATRGRLRLLFRNGRISLVIGIVCLASSVFIGSVLERRFAALHASSLLRESLLIGGWVAMWRPLETFLYDWWPVLAEARLFDRLGKAPVRIRHGG
jgi:hypothetical protein